MPTNCTDEQLKVIESDSKKILVSASAGSGKTSVMIERIARLIEKGESLERMAVVTFTRASAQDMRVKLTKRLVGLSQTPHIIKQINYLPQAEISTIHGWCQRLIRNNFYALDIDPGFEVIEETESAVLLRTAVEDVLEEELKKGEEDFLALYEVFETNRKAEQLKKLLENLINFSRAQSEGEDWLTYALNSGYNIHELKNELKVKREADFIRLIISADDLILRSEAADYQRIYLAAQALKSQLELKEPIKVDLSRSGRILELENLADEFKELREEAKSLYQDFEKDENAIAEVAPDRLSICALKMAIAAAKAYRDLKSGNLDYGDLEHYAKIILESEIKEEILSKYGFIFIDEYQDVNPLQERIFSYFDNSNLNLFFVGDVKQSIYGFRMCSPEMFTSRYARYKEDGSAEVIDLNKNFRSFQGILKFANDVFSRAMTNETSGFNYGDSSMFSLDGEIENAVDAYLFLDEKKEEVKLERYDMFNHNHEADELAAAEAVGIVNKIAEILKLKIRENNEERPVMFSDIAVIIRSDGDGSFTSLLTAKLKESGISAAPVKNSVSVLKNSITLDAINCLRLIENDKDDVLLCAVMLSPFGGFSEEELCQIKGDDEFFYESVENKRAVNEKVEEFYSKFIRYRALSFKLKADELLGLIISECNYFINAFRAGAADYLSEFIKSMSETKSNSSVHDYIAYLDRKEAVINKTGEPNSVKIMTVHASKGLEFPFVILAEIQKKFDSRDYSGNYLLDANLGFALKHFNEETREKQETLLYRVIKERKQEKQLAEELRILYVALTRAKQGLTIFGGIKESYCEKAVIASKSYLDVLYPLIKNIAFKIKAEANNETKAGKKIILSKKENRLTKLLRERFDFNYSYPSDDVKTTATRLAKSEEDTFYYAPIESRSIDNERSLERGSAYQSIMEALDFSADYNWQESRIKLELTEQCAHVNMDEIKTAFYKVKSFIGGAEFFKEMPFVMGDNGVLIQGIVDLLVLNSNGSAYVIDYKTGKKETVNKKSYALQTEVYANAVRRILKIENVKRLIYNFDLGDFIEID